MMPKRTKIATLLAEGNTGFETTVMGWIRTFRNNQFIALNDGSTIQNLQVVVDFTHLQHPFNSTTAARILQITK